MSEFKVPHVRLGDPVLYGQTPNTREWYPALVTAVGEGHISVAVFQDADADFLPYGSKNGCRHNDDPWLDDPGHVASLIEDGSCGVWKESNLQVRVRELEAAVAALAKDSYAAEKKAPKKRVPAGAN